MQDYFKDQALSYQSLRNSKVKCFTNSYPLFCQRP